MVLDSTGQELPDEALHTYEELPTARRWEFSWHRLPGVAVLIAWDDPWGAPLVCQNGEWIAAGIVRLDNREDLEQWVECEPSERKTLTDLALLLRVIRRFGTKRVAQVLGDFAFVAWSSSTRIAIAAVDAFAVKKLYYTERRGLFAFASRAEVLHFKGSYEIEYLTRLLAFYTAPDDLSVYAGVRAIPAGSMAMLGRAGLTVEQYWKPAAIVADSIGAKPEQSAPATCRYLLSEATRLRLSADNDTWAQLSGGIDSSSVVSTAQWLAERGQAAHGLAGTVTFVDRAGTGSDERDYSDAVVERWGVRNETIVNLGTWEDDAYEAPLTDQPVFDLHLHPRDRQLCTIVRGAGGRVLLTGWGGDQLFMGSMLYFADWLVRGRVWPAVREMARRAAIGRVSFWELAYKNALLPLLPRAVQSRVVHDSHESPAQPWLNRATMRLYGIRQQSPFVPEYLGQLGNKYRQAISARMVALPQVSIPGVIADCLDVRHPLLSRPLVEFALRLPPELRAKPHAQRWVLREAMREILPEKVRTRVGKSDTGAALAWSLNAGHTTLVPLLQEPVLAELGIVNATSLRKAFDTAFHRTGRGECMHASLLSTLAVEAWLQIRSGRWPRRSPAVPK